MHKATKAVFKAEASGVRTATVTVLPLIIGQMTGHATTGLMIGLGGLNVATADTQGATLRTMLLATLGAAIAVLFATAVGSITPLAVLLMFLVAFAGGMLVVYGEVFGQLGFVVTAVFAVTLGIPNSVSVGMERGVEFSIGGLLATLATLLLWRVTSERNKLEPSPHLTPATAFTARWKRRWSKLKRSITSHSTEFQHAIRLAFISAFAVFLYKTLHLAHGSWLTLTVLVIVKPDYSSTRKRAAERIYGTLAGGILALLIAANVHNIIVIDILLLGLSVIAYSHLNKNYWLYVIFLTPFVVLLLNLADPGDTKLAFERVINTLIGGALALITAYLLRPRQREYA